eukprot:gene4348-8513_t
MSSNGDQSGSHSDNIGSNNPKYSLFEAIQQAIPRRRRRINTIQQVGLILFVMGIIAVYFSFRSNCKETDEAQQSPCDNTNSQRLFFIGIILIFLFCCCPCFALGEARLFYDHFPWLKKHMKSKKTVDGTYHAHAASLRDSASPV